MARASRAALCLDERRSIALLVDTGRLRVMVGIRPPPLLPAGDSVAQRKTPVTLGARGQCRSLPVVVWVVLVANLFPIDYHYVDYKDLPYFALFGNLIKIVWMMTNDLQ